MSVDTPEPVKMTKLLDWTYDLVLVGAPGLPGVEKLAQSYVTPGKSLSEQIDSLIRWQTTKTAATGFVTGLGGLLTLPIAVPADIASTLYVQLRMIAAIAVLCDLDVHHDSVRTLIYLCLVAKGPSDVARQLGIEVSKRLTKLAVQKVPGRVLIQLNKQVGFRLATKFGEKGLINLGKAVPLAGGVVSGTVNAVITRKIGQVAKQTLMSMASPA